MDADREIERLIEEYSSMADGWRAGGNDRLAMHYDGLVCGIQKASKIYRNTNEDIQTATSRNLSDANDIEYYRNALAAKNAELVYANEMHNKEKTRMTLGAKKALDEKDVLNEELIRENRKFERERYEKLRRAVVQFYNDVSEQVNGRDGLQSPTHLDIMWRPVFELVKPLISDPWRNFKVK